MNRTQIRKFYLKEHGLTAEECKGYEVHHIDLNPENNHVLNLVLLPKALHQKLHKELLFLKMSGGLTISSFEGLSCMLIRGPGQATLIKLQNIINVLAEYQQYMDLKNERFRIYGTPFKPPKDFLKKFAEGTFVMEDLYQTTGENARC